MAKNGYRIFDSDTHVGPFVDILEPYLAADEKALLEDWAPYRQAHRKTGRVTYTRGQRQYRRRLGTAEPAPVDDRYMAGYTGAKRPREPDPDGDADPAKRIADLDLEGVDVNLMLPSGWFGTWTLGEDAALETAMYRAYHRWMADYCGAYPDRLFATILVCARDVEGSLAEIERWGKARWPLGILVYAEAESPLDHPDLERIWAAAQEYDLAVTLHTFTVMPPYAPGGRDNWQNLWLQRSASHPWCGMRNMAAMLGSGAMDRYPTLRIGTLEAGHSWLPFWMARIDDQAEMIASALPELKHRPSDYVQSGRYFQSIEIPEGEKLTRMVLDQLGEDILMYASDYPHGESWFPRSVETVMGWDLPERVKRKLFWDNAVRLYARFDA